MKKVIIATTFLLLLMLNHTWAGASERINIKGVYCSNNCMNYNPWLNDDMGSLIQKVWLPTNMQYVDVALALERKALVTKISLYDYEGIFTSAPAFIYASYNNQETLIGTFEGLDYKKWVDIFPASPILADSIIVKKYGNNVPQKIKVFGLIPGANPPVANTPTPIVGKIPVDGKRWYQLVNATKGMEALFDGVTNVQVNTGWGKILTNYDAYYPVLQGEMITLDSIKFFDGAGSNTSAPVTISVINSQWQRIPIATFTGTQYNAWVGPDPTKPLNAPNRFALANAMTDVKYIVLNTSGAYPNEIEFYGSYLPPTQIPPAPKKDITLNQMMGVNAFEWDFIHPNHTYVIDTARMRAAKSFTGIRHYIDWEKLEMTEGNYTFNPCHMGGWNYDTLYQACKAEGIEVLADIKTIPDWMQQTWPAGQRDLENVPLRYGKDYSDPLSYLEQAKVAFQFAARYGSNPNVPTSLLSVNTAKRWSTDPANFVRKGMNVIKYMESDNERDKWWKGRKAYQTAREYAANLSAFYDGHKNTMGPGVGVKNADPNMKVVMGGVASVSVDYLMGMIDWCREFRGYNPDGSINLCWDVINYHIYSNDAASSQSSTSSRGAAPEVTGTDSIAKNFIEVAHRFAKDMPVWITETGYDVNQSSPLKAIPIGNKSVLETQADWILRTCLVYARSGIERVFLYQMYDDNPTSGTKFASSGLLNANRTRKPAADYLVQTSRLMGNYVYKQTINSNPFVDKYELNGKPAYVLVKPSENGSSVSYTLNLGTATQAKIYTPAVGQDTMNVQIVNTNNGSLTITVTETPKFVIPVVNGSSQLKIAPETGTPSSDAWASTIRLYPNPVTDFINLSMENKEEGDVFVRIVNVAGQVLSAFNVHKDAFNFIKRIDLSALENGLYIVEVRQGKEKFSQTIFKG